MSLGVFPRVFSPVLFSTSFFVLFQVFFPMSWRRLSGECLVMHFVGDGVGFFRRFLVIVFAIIFAIAFLIGIQRFLQLFEFGGLDIRFGHRFD